MKSVLSPLMFLLTLVLGAFAFAYATIQYNDAMRDLTASAHGLPDRLQSLGLSSQYIVWADILLGGDKLIFLSFIIMARVFLALSGVLIGFVLGGRHEKDPWRDHQPVPARGRGRGRGRTSALDQQG
jgi:hypothetical protein